MLMLNVQGRNIVSFDLRAHRCIRRMRDRILILWNGRIVDADTMSMGLLISRNLLYIYSRCMRLGLSYVYPGMGLS